MIRRFVRFSTQSYTGYGLLDEGEEKIREIEGSPFGEHLVTDRWHDQSQVRISPPCQPSKIVAVGLNYRDHARELNLPEPDEPLLFLKPPSAVIGHEGTIIIPAMSQQVEYEGELAIVIGKRAGRVKPEDAADYIAGYTCANDVTARDLQKKDGQWTRAKSFDTFASFGPCLVSGLDADNLGIRTYLNGQLRQSSHTSQLIFSPAFLVSFISRIMTLLPHDIILTGTPAGVGALHPGDVVEVEIECLGRLRNKVITE
ncbi:MAG: fumarylacetoacetate hydrolase family protein [bacterium]